MKYCPECGAKVEGMKFCPECGKSLSEINSQYQANTESDTNPSRFSHVQNTAETQNKRKKRGCLAGIILVSICLIVGVVLFWAQNSLIQKSVSSTSSDSEYITLDEFNAIDNGMTYDKVVEIIGSSGELSSESGVGDYNVQIYTWYGNGLAGSNANITFTNGEVTGKAQVGLTSESSTKKDSTVSSTTKNKSNEKSHTNNKIVGSWTTDDQSTQLTFNSDGTCEISYGIEYNTGTYKIEGNKLILSSGLEYTYSFDNGALILKSDGFKFICYRMTM